MERKRTLSKLLARGLRLSLKRREVPEYTRCMDTDAMSLIMTCSKAYDLIVGCPVSLLLPSTVGLKIDPRLDALIL